jgi:hypothetical protein
VQLANQVLERVAEWPAILFFSDPPTDPRGKVERQLDCGLDLPAEGQLLLQASRDGWVLGQVALGRTAEAVVDHRPPARKEVEVAGEDDLDGPDLIDRG